MTKAYKIKLNIIDDNTGISRVFVNERQEAPSMDMAIWLTKCFAGMTNSERPVGSSSQCVD